MSTATQEPTQLWASEPSTTPGQQRIRAKIAGLHCSLCTGTIEKALGRMDGVGTVSVSLTHEQALVDYDPEVVEPEQVLGTLRDIGYELYDPRKLRAFEDEEADLLREGKRLFTAIGLSLTAMVQIAEGWWTLLCATLLVAALGLVFGILRPSGHWRAAGWAAAVAAPGALALAARFAGWLVSPVNGWIAAVLAAAMVFGVAPHILRMAYQSARRGILNQHVLLEAGAFGGITGGIIGLSGLLENYPTAEFFAAAAIVATYHIFSEWLSLLVKTRSGQSIKKLLDLQPDLARLVADGGESEVPVEEIAVGQHVRVRPGERVPLDGRIRDGYSAIDLSLVTGEPVPAERGPGKEVVGGSINGTGSLTIEVTATGAEGFLAQVIRHVEDARALKPGILHLVDKVLRVYTPTVLSISALALIAWLAGSWLATGDPDVHRAVFASLGVLVMGYPCAVGIAAPLAIVRGTGHAADAGIVMRTGEAFQTFRLARRIVLDKTGTLTHGRPTVRAIKSVDGGEKNAVLALAAAAENHSEHPLARAVFTAAQEAGLAVDTAEDFASMTGSGVRATVDGQRVLLGRPGLLADTGIDLGALSAWIEAQEATGHTVIVVATDQVLRGAIALGDQACPDAAEAVTTMRQTGMEPVLVTGDNERAARHVAEALGIEQVHAGIRPDGKADIVRDLQADGTRVAMVGDGINDAPALMQADVGIAAGGTDIAVESADIVLLREDVAAVLDAHAISDRAYRRTRTNVALAFTFNGLGIPLATTGLISPVWAMVAMAASVTTIFLNSFGSRPTLLINAIASVGRTQGITQQQPARGPTA